VSPEQLAGTVGAVRPSGLVERGSTITIEVWEEYVQPEPAEGDGDGGDGGDDGDDDKGDKEKEDKGKGQGKGKKDD
jgi:hypothetical protein